ncbi:MAG: ABC transporter permease [Lachnospiraceae bacterium]|nr:ABC transporter permease [Lachnospiraceae bacterium]
MLIRKMLREMLKNPGQFISILILSFLATLIYSGFESNVIGSSKAVEDFHKATNVANAWVYSEAFTKENLKNVKDLDIVDEAQLRTELRGTTVDYDGAQLDIYLMDESSILKPYMYEGEEDLKESNSVKFDAKDKDGVWLSWSFANAWNIKVGDDIELEFNGTKFTRNVRGLIMEPEYEYTIAEKDSDTNFKNIAYVYMGYDAFPVKELPYTTMLVTFTDKALNKAEDKLKEKNSKLSSVMYYENEISDAIDENYAVMIDKESVQGMKRVASELEQHDSFSYTFAMIFLIVAVLVISTSMSRLVERQRTQIGTMNAIGMKRFKITLHYIGYSFFVSFVGAVLGIIIGPIFIGNAMVNMLMSWYMIPNVEAKCNASFYLLTAFVVIVCVLASFLSCRKLLKVPPAAALRPAAPKKAKRIFAEKLPLWNKLDFSSQYNLRDVFRAPMRAVMGIVGTAIGTVLILYAFGCYFLVDDIVVWTFDKLQNYDYQIALSAGESEDFYDDLADELDGELVMIDQVELSKKKHAAATDRFKQTITVIEGKGLKNITDEKANVIDMKEGKIAITSRLAKQMGVEVGDKIAWHIYSKNTWYESEIGLINRTPDTAGITILRKDLKKLGCSYTPTNLVTKKNIMSYKDKEGVSGVYDMAELKKAFIEGYEIIMVLFYVMMIFSIVTVIVVLYNSGNLSFHERFKEFATLKVMGLSSSKIRKILNQENIWFAIIGILVGMPFGKPSLVAMMNSNGDNFDYYIHIPLYLYALSALFVLVVAIMVSLMFARKIKRIDMVGSLKGLE